jgi:hypothetical protein
MRVRRGFDTPHPEDSILIADEEFRVGERAKAEGVDIRSMTVAAGVAQPAGTLHLQ